MSDILARLGVAPIVNAKGPATLLSVGILRPEVAQAMVEASQHCVDIARLQAAAGLAGGGADDGRCGPSTGRSAALGGT